MDGKKSKILVADDEGEIREIVGLLLEGEGYEVVTAENGQEALELADSSVDLYILDVNMPVLSGFAAAAKIRKSFYAPILFLTAYAGESDKVMGFSVGGDDYLVKPFSNTELLIRVKAHLRRAQQYRPASEDKEKEDPTKIPYKDLILDLDSQSVYRDGEVIALTYTEFKILELFITYRRKIFSLDNIYESVWEEEAVGDSTIMVHIKNIRRKLGDSSKNPKYIKTAWGKGYYAD
ncbi:MAG TPA: response regulator transcription factor [Candidatus Dorea gallistercoris]|uniref:Stage 0 sporulation protein A homolog n=1 Tax=Candidatus Dorea gallistercoris TaxID=2838542 RepID=A0A9D1RAU8_9FIRM|nr:response regulator transcription factor [Candidatus Dorea gallistercoris]